MSEKERLLIIQKGDVYIRVPVNNAEAVKFVKEVMAFMVYRIRKQERKERED